MKTERIPQELASLHNFYVKTPTVLQMEATECGAASLGMVLGYFKRFVPLEILRVDCGVSRDGSRADNVLKAARRYGLECHGYSCDTTDLKDYPLPMIIYWNFNHFVVFEGIKNGRLYINDPGNGRRAVSWKEFNESFTGIVLTFKPTAEFEKGGRKRSILPLIRERLESSKPALFYLLITGLLFIFPELVIPSFTRFFVDRILVQNMVNLIKPLVFVMVIVTVIQLLLGWVQHMFLLRLDMKMSLSSSSLFLDHLFKLPMNFFSQRMPGDIVQRMQLNDTVSGVLSEQAASVFLSCFSILFFIVLMFHYDVVLTLLCLACIAADVLLITYVMKLQEIEVQKQSIENGKLYGITMNGIQIIETLKANASENDMFTRWSGQQANLVTENQRISMYSHSLQVIAVFMQGLLQIAVLAVGSIRIMNGNMTLGMLAAFQALMSALIAPVFSLLAVVQSFQGASASMQRLDDVSKYPAVSYPAVPDDGADNDGDIKMQGFVEISHVTFGYSRLAPPLLTDFSLKINPGERIALVGGSGSGKSTVAKLLCGLYDPWEGEILIDGKPVHNISRKRFTSSVSMVDQDIFLFQGTIRENLTMWDTGIKDSDIIRASKDACIHDFISARQGGYYAQIAERGVNFSGGQRQRIEIARALCTNPRILVLDEATSALDPVTEKKVDDNVRTRGCSCLIIAHRLSTIRDADEIIVLDAGKVVERGTHAQLLDKAGYYYTLVKNY